MTGDMGQILADLRAGQREQWRRIDGLERRQETVLALPVELKALSRRMDERFEEFSERFDERFSRLESTINDIQRQMTDGRKESENRGRYYADHRINEEQADRARAQLRWYIFFGVMAIVLPTAFFAADLVVRLRGR